MSNPIEQPEEWTTGYTEDRTKYRFLHDGHRFTIYKRDRSPFWMVKFRHAGGMIARSLKTTDVKLAVARAKKAFDEVKAPDWVPPAEAKEKARQVALVGAIADAYEAGIRAKSHISSHTARENALCLGKIVTEGLGLKSKDDWKEQSAKVLTRTLVRRFQALRSARVVDGSAIEQGRSNLTTDQSWGKARSLFTPLAMEVYEEAGLKLPDLEEFLKTPKRGNYHSTMYQPIPDETIAAMQEAAKELRKQSPGAYLVYSLMLALGMRNGEVQEAKRHWIEERPTLTVVDGKEVRTRAKFMAIICRPDFTPKNKRNRWVPIPTWLLADLEELVPEGQDYILPGATDNQRRQLAYYELNGWIRKFLPDREKGAYELRKHFGSVIAASQGIYKAQEYLGHSSVTTTEQHYSAWLNGRNSRPITEEELDPVRAVG